MKKAVLTILMVGFAFCFYQKASFAGGSIQFQRGQKFLPSFKQKMPFDCRAELTAILNQVNKDTNNKAFKTMDKFRKKNHPKIDLLNEQLLQGYCSGFLAGDYEAAFQKLVRFAEWLRLVDRDTILSVDIALSKYLNSCLKRKGEARRQCVHSILNPSVIVSDMLSWKSSVKRIIKNNRSILLPLATSYPADSGLFCVNMRRNRLEKYTVGVVRGAKTKKVNNAFSAMSLMVTSLAYPETRLNGFCSCSDMAQNGFICNPENPCLQNVDPLSSLQGQNSGNGSSLVDQTQGKSGQSKPTDPLGTFLDGFSESEAKNLGCGSDFKDWAENRKGGLSSLGGSCGLEDVVQSLTSGKSSWGSEGGCFAGYAQNLQSQRELNAAWQFTYGYPYDKGCGDPLASDGGKNKGTSATPCEEDQECSEADRQAKEALEDEETQDELQAECSSATQSMCTPEEIADAVETAQERSVEVNDNSAEACGASHDVLGCNSESQNKITVDPSASGSVSALGQSTTLSGVTPQTITHERLHAACNQLGISNDGCHNVSDNVERRHFGTNLDPGPEGNCSGPAERALEECLMEAEYEKNPYSVFRRDPMNPHQPEIYPNPDDPSAGGLPSGVGTILACRENNGGYDEYTKERLATILECGYDPEIANPDPDNPCPLRQTTSEGPRVNYNRPQPDPDPNNPQINPESESCALNPSPPPMFICTPPPPVPGDGPQPDPV